MLLPQCGPISGLTPLVTDTGDLCWSNALGQCGSVILLDAANGLISEQDIRMNHFSSFDSSYHRILSRQLAVYFEQFESTKGIEDCKATHEVFAF